MVFGYAIPSLALILGGLFTASLVALTMLVGLRIIRFKGRRQMKVHKYLAWSVAGVAVIHGLLGLTYFYGWTIF